MIGAAIRKDVLLLVRDRGALLSLFALPIVFMTAFGLMFDFDRDDRRMIAIWHPAGEPRGLAIGYALTAADALSPSPQPSADAVRRAILDKRAQAGLVITHDDVEVVVDTRLPIELRAALEASLQIVVVRALVPPSQLPRITIASPPVLSNEVARATSFQLAVPGNAVLFGFFLALTVAMSFASERRTGTWQRLLASPIARWRVLVGMLVPYLCIGVCQFAFFFAVGVFAFGMPVTGSVYALVALSLALIYCAVSLGLLFAALGGSERQLAGLGSIVLLVMGMLGGCMVPRLVMSPTMQAIGLAVPHSWAIDGYFDVIVRSATTADVAGPIAALTMFGTAFAAAGIALFRFERV